MKKKNVSVYACVFFQRYDLFEYAHYPSGPFAGAAGEQSSYGNIGVCKRISFIRPLCWYEKVKIMGIRVRKRCEHEKEKKNCFERHSINQCVVWIGPLTLLCSTKFITFISVWMERSSIVRYDNIGSRGLRWM